MKLLQKIETHYEQNLPFVAYRKINSDTITAFFQRNATLFLFNTYDEVGFVFAPFDIANPSILLPKNESDFFEEKINIETSFKEVVSSKGEDKKQEEQHKLLVDKAIASITENHQRKVVISRKEQMAISNFNLVETFKKLLLKYQNAMVYVWYHPKVGLWFGATPERLLDIKGNDFETMSLAGTQVFKGLVQVQWQEKELDEQQIVTDYIVGNLEPFCEQIVANEVETVKAGNLLHLKSKISGKIATNTDKGYLKKVIMALHPTPAVCGFPKEVAKQFILENEYYDREFYTGFLGELNLNATSTLFVNLRCMQIKHNKAFIYVGGGITQNSNSQKEWEETQAKATIMKSVL